MRDFTPKALFLLFLFLSLCGFSHGQDIPAVTSVPAYRPFSFPDTNGSLSYSLSLSESGRIDYYGGGNSFATGISGNFGYLSKSSVDPFSISYSGGTSFSTTTPSSQPIIYYQSLTLSKGLTTRFATFSFSDSLSYLPNAANGGYSGVPDGGLIPVAPVTPSQDILTYGTSARIGNSFTAGASRQISASNSLNASGTYSILTFLGDSSGNNMDTNSVTASAGLGHRIDARSSSNLSYNYSSFFYPNGGTATYPGAAPFSSFSTQSLSVGYSRNLTRKTSANVSGGPQRTSANSSFGPTYNFSGSASLSYAAKTSSTSLNLSRGVNNGSGVVQGALSTSAGINYSRTFGRAVHFSSGGSYTQNSSIAALTNTPFSTKGISATAQASRSIGRYLSVNASYYLAKQLVDGSALSTNAFNGLSQVISFGISYSPRPIQVGHQ